MSAEESKLNINDPEAIANVLFRLGYRKDLEGLLSPAEAFALGYGAASITKATELEKGARALIDKLDDYCDPHVVNFVAFHRELEALRALIPAQRSDNSKGDDNG